MATKGYIPEKSGSKVPQEFSQAWSEIQQRNYIGQGKWFLNGFWDEIQNDAEQIWGYAQKFIELDTKDKKEGIDLDEFASHKFLESLGETMTVIQMRQALREIDLDNNNRMSFLEYLTYKYKKNVKDVVNAPQGGQNQEKINEAQELISQAQNALEEVQRKLEAQKEAVRKQQEAEGLAKKALGEQKAAEEEVRKAEEEQRKTLEELQRQEKEYKDKCDDLERKTKEGTIVQKNKAVQELAALKNEDPLPLRRAKINQEAAVRKAEKLTKAAQEKTKIAEEKARQAEEARLQSEEAARQLEVATQEAEDKVREAEENLEKVKKECRDALGDLWWMDRDLKEAKKYLPQRKQ